MTKTKGFHRGAVHEKPYVAVEHTLTSILEHTLTSILASISLKEQEYLYFCCSNASGNMEYERGM